MLDNCQTKRLKLTVVKQNLTQPIMKEIKVTVREFLRDFKNITSKNNVIIITKNGKEKGVFVQYEQWKKRKKKEKEEMSIGEICRKYATDLGDPNLSKNIDKYIYEEWEN